MPSLYEIEHAVFDKKYWIPVTHLCNNNCIFCLMDKRSKTHHRKFEEIRIELEKVEDKENTRLVISGGEPTIHPKIIDIISFARQIGFKRIQIITNGRMFGYRDFTDKIISAGLGEVTFSIHGHTTELHDSLTRSTGAFEQVMKGVKNVISYPNVIVNADIVITNQNSRYLEDIVNYLMDNGIMELNLHSITPFGNAYDNIEQIDYDFEEIAPYVHRAIDACKKRNAVLWMSRFPPQYLYGYEEFIIDSYKILEQDLEGRISAFQGKKEFDCKGRRCKYCSINIFCNKLSYFNKATIEKENFDTVVLDAKRLDLNQIKKKINISQQFKPKKIVIDGNENLSDAIYFAKSKCFEQIEVITDFHNENIEDIVECGATQLKFKIKNILSNDIDINKKIKAIAEIEINKNNFKDLENITQYISKLNFSEFIFKFVEPGERLYQDYFPVVVEIPLIKIYLQNSIDAIIKNSTAKIKIYNIPPCFLDNRYIKFVYTDEEQLNLNDLTEEGILDVLKFSKNNIHKIKIKGLQCKNCKYDNRCDGIFKKYIRLFGFKSLVTVKK